MKRMRVLLVFACVGALRAGALTFSDSGQSFGESDSVEIDVGDTDNDGDYDLLVGSRGSSGAVEVYTNNGAGVFGRLDQSFPQARPSSGGSLEDVSFGVVLTDVNNDGWLDVVTADAWDGVNIYLNDATGHFIVSQLGLGTTGIEVKGVDLGDIDNDGDFDMIFGGHQWYRDNEVWTNCGGVFADTGERHYSEAIWHLAFADIDSDDDLDYIWTSRYSEPGTRTEVYFNRGNGTFTNSLQNLTPIGNSFGLVVRDVDSDGDLDFVEPNCTGDTGGPDVDTNVHLRVFLNNGKGFFSDSGQNLGGDGVKDVDLGDVDNDGDYDMFVANWSPEDCLWRNNGAGMFSHSASPVLLPQGTHACKLADIDGDGDLDVVTGNLVTHSYHVYFSDQSLVSSNSSPARPSTLHVAYSNDTVVLSWNGASDVETATALLTYNLRVGVATNLYAIFSGAVRYGPGNMGNIRRKQITGLPPGQYVWAVQTVDTGYRRSAWSIPGTFVMPPDTNVVLITSFDRNGTLTWMDQATQGFHSVQWASSLTGNWYNTWDFLVNFSATGGTRTVEVPMFYRVIRTSIPITP